MASTAPPDAYWTCEQLAAHLQVPLATVYRWRHLGTGPRGIRVGKHVRFSPQAVERWIEAQADPEPSTAA